MNLSELEELCNKATPLGERCPEQMYLFSADGGLVAQMRDYHGDDPNYSSDYEFYFAARTALPELIARVRELEANNAFMKDVFEKQKDYIEKGINRDLENSRLRAALGEMKGILSAHEHAIRADAGNTNWQIMVDKVREALRPR